MSSPDVFAPSPGQDAAIRAVRRWIADPAAPQVFCLAGVAGSGKSTLVQEIVGQSGRSWLYAAYTGKAALVMQRKGCHGARTLHSLIYRPEGDAIVDEDGRSSPTFRLWGESPLIDAFGVVVDEGSMVDDELADDLLSFGRRVLVMLDPAQLPPIEGGGYFSRRDPDVFLTEVHRQARDSGILDLATFVREGGDVLTRVGWSTADCEVVSRDRVRGPELFQRMVQADQVVVGTNATRHQFNARYRKLCRISDSLPVPGEKLICLRNERRTGLLNGSMWRSLETSPGGGSSTVDLRVETLDGLYPSRLTSRSWIHHFEGREADLLKIGPVRLGFQEFDFGYFITAHKAQGSQWDDVVVYDESRVFRKDRARWLYTGITRAARRLLVVT